MAEIHIYVDGSGRPRGGFGWFVQETGESHYEARDNITNNQAEYMAIISALHHVQTMRQGAHGGDDVVILSDSLNTVRQLNHEYAINNAVLRELAIKAWSEIAKLGGGDGNNCADGNAGGGGRDTDCNNDGRTCRLQISWVRRSENLAGKMLGS